MSWFNRKRVPQSAPIERAPSAPLPMMVPLDAATMTAMFTGVATLANTLFANEIKRLEATSSDRAEERAWRRDMRQKQREAAIETNLKKGLGKGAKNCKVCARDYSMSVEDLNRHYADGHPTVSVEVPN